MNQKIKFLKRITLFLCILMLSANCASDDNLKKQGGNSNAKLKETQKWFNKYESDGENYFLLENLEYNWDEAKITNSEDGTETTIVPIIESKKDNREFWEQRLYIYKTGKEDYKALVYEIATNKYVPVSSQSIDGGEFTGFISVWDLKTGFVRAARFENNQVIETGVVEVIDYTKRNSTNKAPIEAPCVYADFGDGGCGGKGGSDNSTPTNLPGIVLREVPVIAPSKGSPVEYYGPRSPVIGGSTTGGYTSPGGGGGNSGGANIASISTQAQFIAAIENTDPNAYNFTFVQTGNTITVTATIGLVPFANITLEITQGKVADKYVVKNIVTNLTGVTTGLGWLQTSYSQTTIGNTTTLGINGIVSIVMPIDGLGTIYSYPMSYSIKVNNTNGKIISGSRVK